MTCSIFNFNSNSARSLVFTIYLNLFIKFSFFYRFSGLINSTITLNMEEDDNVNNIDKANKEREAAEAIFSIMEYMKIPFDNDSAFEIEKFDNEIEMNLSSNLLPENATKLLSNSPFNEAEWKQLDKYAHFLNEDYSKRVELLKKRLEATIDSFLWSERVQKLEPKIQEICELSLLNKAKFEPIGIDQFLAADSDLLVVNKTSSDKFRQNTKVKEVTDYKMRQLAFDRGGRVEQMAPMMRETFEEQRNQRMQQQHGGGFRGGGSGNRRDGGGTNFYQQQHDGGRGYRGRGNAGHPNQRGNKRGRYN